MRKIILTVIAFSLPVAVFAADGAQMVKDRQQHMKSLGGSMKQLAGMAKGETDYDATAAQAAADNIAKLAAVDLMPLFPEGTSVDDMPGVSEASPKIWTQMSDFQHYADELQQASVELAKVAGEGKGKMAPALGAVGKACSGCHKPFHVE